MNRSEYRRHIGNLIRIARKRADLSQMKLAELIGISYQQVQKYEKGVSEVSIARLFQIAHALRMPVSKFISDAEEMMVSEPVGLYETLSDDEIKLLKFFREIKDKDVKDGLLTAIKGIAGSLEKKRAKGKTKA